MKNKFQLATFLVMITSLVSSCTVVEGIFKAGAWTGITLVLLVVFLIVYIISKARRK